MTGSVGPAAAWVADYADVTAACTAFVGSHFALSHPYRRRLVQQLGSAGFLGVYSLVAAATLVWIALAYRAAPSQPLLWEPGDAIWAVGTVVMLVASILLMGSLIGNPALPDPTGRARPVPVAQGVFAVTRHPMMWAFALWAAAHILVFPDIANIIVALSIAVLALAGAHLQDRKKAQLEPRIWPEWERRTSYLPFVAIAKGRARFGGFRPHDLAGGVVIWLAATWAHLPLAGWSAGVWRWVG